MSARLVRKSQSLEAIEDLWLIKLRLNYMIHHYNIYDKVQIFFHSYVCVYVQDYMLAFLDGVQMPKIYLD